MQTPWTEGNVTIPESVLSVVEEAGRAAYARNEEACGYLEGPAAEPLGIDRAVELENLANKYHLADPEGHPRTGHDYFKINALKFERAIRTGIEGGRPVKVFFHSHLDCGAYFSAEDAASMTMGGTGAPAGGCASVGSPSAPAATGRPFSERMMARSMVFCSSRTLPGQG